MAKLVMKENTSSPDTPSSGYVSLYPKTDGALYIKDDTGNESKLALQKHPPTEFSYNELTTTSTSYVRMSAFIFHGTDDTGAIQFIKFTGYRAGGTGTCYARLYDVTNALQIAEITFTNTSLAIIAAGSFSNVPTGEAMFELQMKVSTASTTAAVFSVMVDFEE